MASEGSLRVFLDSATARNIVLAEMLGRQTRRKQWLRGGFCFDDSERLEQLSLVAAHLERDIRASDQKEVELTIARQHVKKAQAEAEMIRPMARNPVVYLENAFIELFDALRALGPEAGFRQAFMRTNMPLVRLKKILDFGQKNLRDISRPHGLVAIKLLDYYLEKFDNMESLKGVIRNLEGFKLAIDKALGTADKGLIPDKDIFGALVCARTATSEVDFDLLLQQAEHEFSTVTREITETERAMNDAHGACPRPLSFRDILDCYETRLERTAERLEHLFDRPEECFSLRTASSFESPLIPESAYRQKPCFGRLPHSASLIVAALPDNQTRLTQSGLGLMLIHEIFPGHHLQFSQASQTPATIKDKVPVQEFCEGWAWHGEELVFAAEKLPLSERLAYLKRRLLLLALVICDIRTHAQELTSVAATREIMDRLNVGDQKAKELVGQIRLNPADHTSFYICKGQIDSLVRTTAKKMPGGGRQAYKRLLGFGHSWPTITERFLLDELEGSDSEGLAGISAAS